MNKLWKEFEIQNVFITEAKSKKSQVPTGAYIHKENLLNGTTPRITVTSQNNGIDGYYISSDKNYRVFSNFISVSFLGTIFYHPYEASLDMKVHCLKLKDRELNFHISMFLISEIKKSIENASYGNQLSSTDLPHKKIMLPINEFGKPDYEFMEQYIKEREAIKRKEYLKYCSTQLKKIENCAKSIEIKSVAWAEFFLKDIFPCVQRGKRLTREKQTEGNTPYVSSSALNNGVDNFIGNTSGVRKFKNCLSLANSGSVGSCFYEPFEFVASDHITHLKKEALSPYQYLFISTMLNRLSEKYNFNREINDTRISREKILLPIDENGKPNYTLMEQYAKHIVFKKYDSYIEYCKTL